MTALNRRTFLRRSSAATGGLGLLGAGSARAVGLERQVGTYHGWGDALFWRNPVAEVVIVPSIGRVMQFRLRDQALIGIQGPLWENEAFQGKPFDPAAPSWMNYGGDKTWPAPQEEWPTRHGRAWPPPASFDGLPLTLTWEGETLVLTSPVCPHYGIKTERRLTLDPQHPFLRLETTYHKVSGSPVPVSVWVITQLRDPVLVAAPLLESVDMPGGFVGQSKDRPSQLNLSGGLVTLNRRTDASTKIGLPGRSLVWIGAETVLKIDAMMPATKGLIFPDKGSRSEIYTNPDPLPYVELETLGPLVTLAVGEKTRWANVMKLSARQSPDPLAEAKRLLGR
jgi:Domain of unknown function (DUF4380)